MTVKENYDTCNKDYVCQTIDPICGPCFEYTDGSVGLSVCSSVHLFVCLFQNDRYFICRYSLF